MVEHLPYKQGVVGSNPAFLILTKNDFGGMVDARASKALGFYNLAGSSPVNRKKKSKVHSSIGRVMVSKTVG